MTRTSIALAALLLCACSLHGDAGLAKEPAVAAAAELRQAPAVAAAVDLLDLWIEEQRAYRGVPGLVVGVVHDQDLIWAAGYGVSDLEERTPATPATVYRLGSITKLFNATAVMQLRDAGKLRLDDPVRQHLPWFAVASSFDGEPEVTIRHLLTHTSGLPREAAFPYWTTHDFPTREEIVAALPGQSAVFPPATTYKYSNLGMALLGEIVAAVSGEPWGAYVDRHILAPLGMTSSSAAPTEEHFRKMTTAYLRRTADGGRKVSAYYDTGGLAPAAAMVSTVEDLAHFAALQFRDAPRAGGAQILRGSTLREMHRPHWVNPDWNGGRGLGWSVSRRQGQTVVSHGGWVAGHRSHLLLVPAEKLAVIAITNADDASPSFFAYRVVDVLGPAIAGAAAPEPEGKTVADPAWQRYLGVYADPWGWEYRVLILDGELVLYEHNYPPEEDPADGLTRLEPVAEHTFKMSDGELVVFELAEDGTVERVRRRYDYIYPVKE